MGDRMVDDEMRGKEYRMKRKNSAEIARLKAKIVDLEVLVEKWAHANDPESKWMLYLLREALEMGRLKLRAMERN